MTPAGAREMTPTFHPTEEQEAVREAVAKRSGSVMVEAGAGCAKTSTLKLAAPGVRVPALGLAFNKRIAEDMEKAVPGNISVRTMNGLGHRAWGGAVAPGTSLKLDDRKLAKIVTSVMREEGLEKDEDLWEQVRTLTRSAMAVGLVPSGSGPPGLVEDSEGAWTEMAQEGGVPAGDCPIVVGLARRVLVEDIKQARAGHISFDDQIYCSTMLGGRFTKYPVVLVDEDQDLSPLNIRMLGQSLAPGGRIVAVGDRRQAIYAWRGACGDSAERIRALVGAEGAWTDLPLMTTFRCPKAVVARQQEHVPGFRAAEGNQEGKVIHWRAEERPDGEVLPAWGWGDVARALPGSRASLAVLCRNNAPLVRLGIKLIKRQIGVVMLGRDLGRGLESLVRKLGGGEKMPVSQLLVALDAWQEGESASARDSPRRLESIQDRADCVLAVAESSAEIRTSGDLLAAIKKLFDRTSGLVTLSSIHRAKGAEWDCVMHLDPWRIHHGVQRARARGDLVQVEQEWNLRYVAETRTRDTLLLGNLEDWRDGG